MIGLHRWTAQTARQTEFARCTPPIPIMSYKSDFTEPSKLFKAIPKALVAATVGFTSDDLPCLLSLFFDNLSTLVGVGGAFTHVVGDYASDIRWRRRSCRSASTRRAASCSSSATSTWYARDPSATFFSVVLRTTLI